VSAALALCPDEALAPLSGADQEAAALAAIVLIEQLKARLDALAVSAWRGLYAGYAREAAERLVPLVEAARAGAAVRGSLPGPAALRAQAAAAVRGGVVAEVMAATGLPEGECWRRLRLATAEPARSEGLIAMLAAGEADLARVARLCDEISELDAEEAGEVALRVVAPCRDGSVASHALVGRRLRRALAQHRADDPAAAAKHAERAKRARRTSAELFDDGTGVVRIVGEAARVCSVMSRIDALARGLRAGGGDPRPTAFRCRFRVAHARRRAGCVRSAREWTDPRWRRREHRRRVPRPRRGGRYCAAHPRPEVRGCAPGPCGRDRHLGNVVGVR
jgi:hypothetical protein